MKTLVLFEKYARRNVVPLRLKKEKSLTQSRKAAKPQSRKAAKPQSRKAAKAQRGEMKRSHRARKGTDGKTTEPRWKYWVETHRNASVRKAGRLKRTDFSLLIEKTPVNVINQPKKTFFLKNA